MTSNIASDLIQSNSGEKSKLRDLVLEHLARSFRPEFINRLEHVVIYNSLSPKDIVRITEIELNKVKARIAENDIDLNINNELLMYFAEKGYDPVYGARPLRRRIEEDLLDVVALAMIEGNVKPGDSLSPKIIKNKISFSQIEGKFNKN